MKLTLTHSVAPVQCNLQDNYAQRLPIIYNEASFMKLHRMAQIKNLNNVSMPRPLDKSDDESTTDSNDAVEESHMTPSFDCALEESSLITKTDSIPDHPEVESPKEKYSTTDKEESPMTLDVELQEESPVSHSAKTNSYRRSQTKEWSQRN